MWNRFFHICSLNQSEHLTLLCPSVDCTLVLLPLCLKAISGNPLCSANNLHNNENECGPLHAFHSLYSLISSIGFRSRQCRNPQRNRLQTLAISVWLYPANVHTCGWNMNHETSYDHGKTHQGHQIIVGHLFHYLAELQVDFCRFC